MLSRAELIRVMGINRQYSDDPSSICGGCGSHVGLSPLPAGVELTVQENNLEDISKVHSRMEDALKHLKTTRYEVFRDNIELDGGFHAWVSYTQVVDADAVRVPYYAPNMLYSSGKNPEWNKCLYGPGRVSLVYDCYWRGGLNNAMSVGIPEYRYVEGGVGTSKKLIMEGIKHYFDGSYFFFVVSKYCTTQLEAQTESIGLTQIYKSKFFNNRRHEEVENYLVAYIYKVS